VRLSVKSTGDAPLSRPRSTLRHTDFEARASSARNGRAIQRLEHLPCVARRARILRVEKGSPSVLASHSADAATFRTRRRMALCSWNRMFSPKPTQPILGANAQSSGSRCALQVRAMTRPKAWLLNAVAVTSVLSAARPAMATPITSSASIPVTTQHVEFQEFTVTNGTLVTNQYQSLGVAFGPLPKWKQADVALYAGMNGQGLDGTSGETNTSGCPGIRSIYFTQPTTFAGFNIVSDLSDDARLTALAAGMIVETHTFSTDASSGHYIGFLTTQPFDELQLEIFGPQSQCMALDHLAFGVCGNNIIDGNEECDDGNSVYNDACTYACRAARCGDGRVWAGIEDCDDGNDNNFDACTECGMGGECGDGFVQPLEDCDDGNSDVTDDCPAGCVVASCGDGFVHADHEACDDGNVGSGDGCSTTCQIETATIAGAGGSAAAGSGAVGGAVAGSGAAGGAGDNAAGASGRAGATASGTSGIGAGGMVGRTDTAGRNSGGTDTGATAGRGGTASSGAGGIGIDGMAGRTDTVGRNSAQAGDAGSIAVSDAGMQTRDSGAASSPSSAAGSGCQIGDAPSHRSGLSGWLSLGLIGAVLIWRRWRALSRCSTNRAAKSRVACR
jgi:cysteine-rich repeat protein